MFAVFLQLWKQKLTTATFSLNVFIKCSNLYYIRSTEVNKVQLVLQMVNYFSNSAWKLGRKVQNHCNNNAFCAVGFFIVAPCICCCETLVPLCFVCVSVVVSSGVDKAGQRWRYLTLTWPLAIYRLSRSRGHIMRSRPLPMWYTLQPGRLIIALLCGHMSTQARTVPSLCQVNVTNNLLDFCCASVWCCSLSFKLARLGCVGNSVITTPVS